MALIKKKRFRVLRPEIHYRTTKESPDHPKLTKIDTFFGGGSYGAGYTFAAYYTIDNAPLHLYVTRATPLCYTYAHTYGVPWYSVPHTLGILGMALRIWLRVSSSGPTVEAWPHPGIISTTACGTICCKNCDV